MIKVDQNGFELKGTGLEIRAEIVMAMTRMIKSHFITEDELHQLVHIAATPQEQLQEEIDEKMKQAEEKIREMSLEDFTNFMKELFIGR